MAEAKKGFFRRIFSFGSDHEDQRVPENGQTPRASDTELGRPESPDPDVRPQAAAHAVADTEAGADVSDGGGITPLKDMQAGAQDRTDDTAQKKTS